MCQHCAPAPKAASLSKDPFGDLAVSLPAEAESLATIHGVVTRFQGVMADLNQDGRPFAPNRASAIEDMASTQDKLNRCLNEYLSARIGALHQAMVDTSLAMNIRTAAGKELRQNSEISSRRYPRSSLFPRSSLMAEFANWSSDIIDALNLVASSAVADKHAPIDELRSRLEKL